MSELKRKIQETIVDPAAHTRRSFSMVALVLESNERNNLCTIEFIDKDGYKSNKNNVPVRLYNSCIIDWFPKTGEYVNVEETDGAITILSKYEGGYGSSVRVNTKLKKDILPTSFVDTMAGYIL